MRHILDGERVDDTLGDIVVPRNQVTLEDIPVRAWVVDVARQSLCQKSTPQSHQHGTLP